MTQGGSWNAETEKQNPYHPSLHVVTINGFQFLLSSINCLPSYPIGRRYLPYSSPYPVYMPHPISKWPTRPLSHSLYPGYKSGLRTPVQRWFSLELARCSNSVSHSNKFASLSLCLMSRKSFPAHAQTKTIVTCKDLLQVGVILCTLCYSTVRGSTLIETVRPGQTPQ